MSNTKYVDPLLDLSFKRIFSVDQNRDLLIAFLNEVFKGRKRIVDLTYNKNEHHGNNKEEGSAIFDLLCTGDQGEKILIEVQNGRPVNFKKRAIFYTSRLISEQAPKGEMDKWKYDITEVYFLAILDEKLKVGEEYFQDICLCNRKTREIFYEGLGYTFIELSNFVKTVDELESDLDRWLYSLKYLGEMDNMPLQLQNNAVFEKLYNIAEYSNMTPEEQEIYDRELKRKWDNEAVKEQQRLDYEEGLKRSRVEGEEIGKEIGRVEEKMEIALVMKKKGFEVSVIAELTQLTPEEVEKL
ncbi:Rpn family recombination-promoting nuclease/putative transposase [Pedobacter sp.]|uniref:Rpn family recombination-promoting nuclease/putative transposase n=1 Tax=Pedobacter sp. TaxID=1411316 RepID=UPI002CDD2580|nr:Rpn family recombination-promoting nuclease/putative transposase [Pedobacter sp.]HWW38714.1 Rpn family recombination-promoting nuclease/putative transposase [Pedobacter sp.]